MFAQSPEGIFRNDVRVSFAGEPAEIPRATRTSSTRSLPQAHEGQDVRSFGSLDIRVRHVPVTRTSCCGKLTEAKRSCFGFLAHCITEASARYAQRNRPKRILLVRHGESLGNVDSTAYSRIPDNQVPLTEKGHDQATTAGYAIAHLTQDDKSILAFVSPYQRTQETFNDIQACLGDKIKRVIHEPNLREQDFGNFQDTEMMKNSTEERRKFGRFFYRWPHGESGADVYSRAESFIASLFRHMDNFNRGHYDTVLIVSHGIVMRMLLMRFMRWTVEEYEQVYNPDNCAIWMLSRDQDGEFYLVDDSDDDRIAAPIRGVDGERQPVPESQSRCHNRLWSSVNQLPTPTPVIQSMTDLRAAVAATSESSPLPWSKQGLRKSNTLPA